MNGRLSTNDIGHLNRARTPLVQSMAFTLWDFLLSSLLFVNSVAILNEERFLSRSNPCVD